MACNFDSSVEEWDSILTRIKQRVDKSKQKRHQDNETRKGEDDLCLGLRKLQVKTPAFKPSKGLDLISKIKEIFDDKVPDCTNQSLISDDDQPIAPVVKKKINRIDSGSSIEQLELDDSSIIITRKTPKKLFIVSSDESDDEPSRKEQQSKFSSDDEWEQMLSPKKKPQKDKPSLNLKPVACSTPLKQNVSSTNISLRNHFDKEASHDDLDGWMNLVSPERRQNKKTLIPLPKRLVDKENDPYEFETDSPRKLVKPKIKIKNSQQVQKPLDVIVSSPLPSSSLFSRYSAQTDPEAVRRKLGIDFDVDEKPTDELFKKKTIVSLFKKFDKELFNSVLDERFVEIDWSGKLTKSAGITHSKTKLLAVECDIKLSRPLLSLRPAKDMIETILHEMIHAYLAVTRSRGSQSHGPEFRTHMHRINSMTGFNITVFHTFHEEVDVYRNKYVWRCDGVCRSMRDFKYGYVRRAINRAPGPHEFWWKKHSMFCSGNFARSYDHPFK